MRNPVLLLSETLVKTAKEMIQSLIEEDEVICEKLVNYARYQAVFDSSVTGMKSASLEKLSQRSHTGDSQRVNAELSEIESELGLRQLLWNSQEEWAKLFFRWKHTIFWNLDVDFIQNEVNRLIQIIHILEKGKKNENYSNSDFLGLVYGQRYRTSISWVDPESAGIS